MKWSPDAFWLKAKVYSDRAHRADHGSSEFPFLCVLALEFLARGALATVHPVLVADPKDDGVSILYACGFQSKGQPKTVEMKTVISRLNVISSEFAERHSKTCADLVYMRNGELHSGEVPFEKLSEGSWLPGFYAAIECLCRLMKRDLDDLLGEEVAESARSLIGVENRERIATVKRLIASHRVVFADKPEAEQLALKEESKEIKFPERLVLKPNQGIAIETCPACGANARKLGNLVSEGNPRMSEGLLAMQRTYMAQHLRCPACGLHLDTPTDLRSAELEPRFSYTVHFDPSDDYEYEEGDPYENM